MKKFFIALMVATTALAVTVSDAQAKRLGGGGSMGKQSQSLSRPAPAQQPNQAAPAQNQAASPAAPQGQPAKPSSPWKGILGGALLGLGLGALLSHFGLGGAFASMIGTILMIALLALAAMFIFRLFRRKQPQPAYAPAPAFAYSGSTGTSSRLEPAALQPMPGSSTASYGAPAAPAGFDTAGFLRHAKTYFIRLQAAWDRADVNDIREFTSPEMFAELRMQLQERGASLNHTDVVSLDAELLGIDTVGNDYIASVKFSGMIKEAENAAVEPFAEIWNLSKPVSGQGGWVLAGIQQLS